MVLLATNILSRWDMRASLQDNMVRRVLVEQIIDSKVDRFEGSPCGETNAPHPPTTQSFVGAWPTLLRGGEGSLDTALNFGVR